VTYDCYVGLGVSAVAYLDGTVTLSNIRSLACGYTGFLFDSSSNIQMSNCSAGHNNAGRYFFAGVQITSCSNVSITNFIGKLGAKSTTARGIYVSSSSDVAISDSILNNWDNGIEIANSSIINVNGNISSNNRLYGIYVLNGDRITVANNTCLTNGDVSAFSAGIYANSNIGFALYTLIGNTCTQNGGGVQNYGLNVNLFDNGASSGFINLVGNMAKFNATAQINITGKVANVTSTGNVV
jgi:parallel beta-helix repeat protein